MQIICKINVIVIYLDIILIWLCLTENQVFFIECLLKLLKLSIHRDVSCFLTNKTAFTLQDLIHRLTILGILQSMDTHVSSHMSNSTQASNWDDIYGTLVICSFCVGPILHCWTYSVCGNINKIYILHVWNWFEVLFVQ